MNQPETKPAQKLCQSVKDAMAINGIIVALVAETRIDVCTLETLLDRTCTQDEAVALLNGLQSAGMISDAMARGFLINRNIHPEIAAGYRGV